MSTTIAALAGVHMIIAAVIIVGWILHRIQGTPLTVVVWAARIQLLLGLVLVGLNEADDQSLNHGKIAVKLVVALAVVACLEIANARAKRGEPKVQLVDAAGVLTIVNTVVAFAWK